MGDATTFGEVTRRDGRWVIACLPHVSTRLKRVFERVSRTPTQAIMLTDTPRNGRELLWFMARFPMRIGAEDLKHLRAQARRDTQSERAVLGLVRDPGRAVAEGVAAPEARPMALAARDYQVVPDRLLALRGGVLLADDVGLGKTASAIFAMGSGQVLRLPALVVCPAHLARQWVSQINLFRPDLLAHEVVTGTPYALRGEGRLRRGLRADRAPDVLVCTYRKLAGWAETLAGTVSMVVFDECQALRNDTTQTHRAATMVATQAPFRLGLSATPIHNYGNEFYHVLRILDEDALGSFAEFQREWCGGPLMRSVRDPEAFGSFLRDRGLLLRRTRAEVRRELPGLSNIVYEIDADLKAFETVGGTATALARIILDGAADARRGDHMRAAGEFDMLMRQATGLAKAPYVAEFVQLLIESGEAVVLYAWHRQVYEVLREKLGHLRPVFYTGTESAREKQAAVDAFVGGETPLMIMSLRAGLGVDGLQKRAATVVYGELDWSASVLEQCSGRLFRDGQDKPVMAYYLLSEEGSDPVMARVLGLKRAQMEGVINLGGQDRGALAQIDESQRHIAELARAFLARHGRRGETEANAVGGEAAGA